MSSRPETAYGQACKVLTDFQQWLKTDLGGSYADLTVEQGAKATADIIFRVDKTESGKHLGVLVPGWEHAEGPNRYDGSVVPW